MSGLVERLTRAATAAIENERPCLEREPGHVRGLTLELTLTSAGTIHEAIAYIETRTSGTALLRRYAVKADDDESPRKGD